MSSDAPGPDDVTEEEGVDEQSAPAPEVVTEADVEAAMDGAESDTEKALAERTLDLQRLQAEYVNYKRRVDRDRDLVRAQGEAAVLGSLLTVLDDIGRAAEHGELEGGFKSVADALQAAVSKHKLEAFGAKGEPFDPSLHEGVFHAGESADVEVTSVDTVIRTGYRVGDRVLRAATVGVVDPVSSDAAVEEEPAVSGEAETGDDQD